MRILIIILCVTFLPYRLHSIFQQTNKQSTHDSITWCAFLLLSSLHHLQDSLFILPFTLSPHPHILVAARLHVLRRQVQQLGSLFSLQHRHQSVVLLRRDLLSTLSSCPTLPTIISCSKLDISRDVYTFISGAFSSTFAPCFDSSLKFSYTPGRISFSSSGVGRCSSLIGKRGRFLLLLHSGLPELHVQLLLGGLQAASHAAYRWAPRFKWLRPIILPCSMRTRSSGRSCSDRLSWEMRIERETYLVFLHVSL